MPPDHAQVSLVNRQRRFIDEACQRVEQREVAIGGEALEQRRASLVAPGTESNEQPGRAVGIAVEPLDRAGEVIHQHVEVAYRPERSAEPGQLVAKRTGRLRNE